MRIISKFHDYYDAGQSTGIDLQTVYLRETSEFQLSNKKDFYGVKLPNSLGYNPDKNQKLIILGFCGQLHYCLIQNVIPHTQAPREYLWDKDEIQEARKIPNLFNKGHGYLKLGGHKTDAPFIGLKTPIFFVTQDYKYTKTNSIEYFWVVTVNPCLKDLQFYKVKDTVTAFQEIYQYITNELVEQRDPKPLSDKERIVQHGFDLKTSFRKEKHQRKSKNAS